MRYDLLMIELALKNHVNFNMSNFVEIGSRDGHDTNTIKTIFNLRESDCYIFEAHPDCYQSIVNTYPSFNTFNCAVSNETKPIEFNAGIVGIEPNIGVSSVLDMTTDGFKSNRITVDGWRFDDICDNIGLSEIDCLKLDVEGYTYEVLESFGLMLGRVKVLQIEMEHYEAWKGQKLYEEIKTFMTDNDFIEVFFIRHSYGQSDALFINKKYYKQ
jgi:FkbM family methyltransferase